MDLVASEAAGRGERRRRTSRSALARHRADTNDPVVVADKRKLADAIDVDEDVVASQPKVQRRHETLSAARILRCPMLCQHDRACSMVVGAMF